MPFNTPHQYIDRETGEVRVESLYGDKMVQMVYSSARERAPFLFNALISKRFSNILSIINYGFPFGEKLTGGASFVEKLGIDLSECLEEPKYYNTALKVFERKICYWYSRPMEERDDTIVAPADSKTLVGSFEEESLLHIKDKFFSYDDLLSVDRIQWLEAFENGMFSVSRLTPEKYHHNHAPVSGIVVDFYEVDGACHSCNPGAVVAAVTPYSKNHRVVTVIDTDVEGGTQIGLVAMVEVVALMIGSIEQYYSAYGYDDPQSVEPGMFIRKGQVKSVFHPGSSVDVLLFQKGRIRFADDLLENLHRQDATSRYSIGFKKQIIETDVAVRSTIGYRA